MPPAKEQDGSGTIPAKEQNEAKAEPRWSLPSDLLKVSALGGALLYGVLFLGYYNYYTRLGLRPEDLGVSYSYILVRSIGFIVLVGAMLGILAILYLSSFGFESGPVTVGDVMRWCAGIVFGGILVVYSIFLIPSSWPSWYYILVPGALISIVFFGEWITNRSRSKGLVVFATLALLMAIVLPTATVVSRADTLANHVLAGQPITPYELFGVPVLDVSASTVTVTWIGPANQRPGIFGEKSSEPVRGLLLGTEAGTAEAGTVVLLINNGNGPDIVQIPSNLVIVEGS